MALLLALAAADCTGAKPPPSGDLLSYHYQTHSYFTYEGDPGTHFRFYYENGLPTVELGDSAPQNTARKKTISADEADALQERIAASHLAQYSGFDEADTEALDGGEWSLQIVYTGGDITARGVNAAPPDKAWYDGLNAVNDYIRQLAQGTP